jgi:cobyrinic acid a,c-diamide synthase
MTGFLIAGTSSGVGKTTVTLAITAALCRRGHIVQPFKGGPDFLDTGHHTATAGRVSRNLDTWMLGYDANRNVLQQAAQGADVLIAEGMMGLFDGKDGDTETGSSAEITRILNLPIVLVLDAGKSARSIAAVVLGFELFDATLPLAGIILNRVASERHFKMLEAAVLSRCATPILGWLPREPEIAIPERYLGLQTSEEQFTATSEHRHNTLANLAEKHLNLDQLLKLQCPVEASPTPSANIAPVVRIGVAYDAAFTFYYEDNFDLLRDAGAEIVRFSPLQDTTLPTNLDALYLGGGYPELHAEALNANTAMLTSIRDFAATGKPVYAECGGMIYLAESLTLKDHITYALASVLPLHVELTPRLVRFGYVSVEFTHDCLLGPAGTTVRGHSFHHSRISSGEADTMLSRSYRILYSLSGDEEHEGFGLPDTNILASYIHLHFRANPTVAQHFVAAALAAKQASMVTA